MQPFERQIKELATRVEASYANALAPDPLTLDLADLFLVSRLCEIALATCFAIRHLAQDRHEFGELIMTKLPAEVVPFGTPFWERNHNTAHDIAAEVAAYDGRLNELEICPNGDDYNNLLRIFSGESGVTPHVTGR